MRIGIERRRHLRAPLRLPIVLIVAQSHIKAMTRDISVSGFSTILPFEACAIEDEFQVILKAPGERSMSVDCKKIWSDSITVHDTVLIGIGAYFTKISTKDRKIIASLIEEFYLA